MNLILNKDKVRDRVKELESNVQYEYNWLIILTTVIVGFIIFFLTRISDLSLSSQQKILLLIQITNVGGYMVLLFIILVIGGIFGVLSINKYKKRITQLYDLLLERKINLTINDFYEEKR